MNPYRSVTPDSQRARRLIHQAEETLEASQHIDEDKFPSQSTKQYYDALHAYLSALSLLEGIKTEGEGAHKDLILYAKEKEWILNNEYLLMDQLRKKRNALLYDGEPVKKEFFQAKRKFILALLDRLARRVEEEFI